MQKSMRFKQLNFPDMNYKKSRDGTQGQIKCLAESHLKRLESEESWISAQGLEVNIYVVCVDHRGLLPLEKNLF